MEDVEGTSYCTSMLREMQKRYMENLSAFNTQNTPPVDAETVTKTVNDVDNATADDLEAAEDILQR